MKTMQAFQHRGGLDDCLRTCEEIPATQQGLEAWVYRVFGDFIVKGCEITLSPAKYDPRINQWRHLVLFNGNGCGWIHTDAEESPLEDQA